jgi:hypothetical protein
MSQLQVSGVTYRPIAGQAPTTRLALAYRRGETSAVVRNFIARAEVGCVGASTFNIHGLGSTPIE